MAAVVLVLGATAAAANTAQADAWRTRSEGLRALSHTVALSCEGPMARVRVERHFKWGEKGAKDVWLDLDVPSGARVASVGPSGGHLVDYVDSGPGLLSIRWAEVEAKSKMVAAYDLLWPVAFEGDAAGVVMLPLQARAGKGLTPPALSYEGRQVPYKLQNVRDDLLPLQLPCAMPGTDPARAATYPLPDGLRQLGFIELVPPLSAAKSRPQGHTVFVVDSSHSQGKAGVEFQLQVLRSFAASAPNERIVVVRYDRRGKRLTDGFIDGRALGSMAAIIEAQAIETQNGSSPQAGLASAVEWFEGLEGPKRVVLFTDPAMPSMWTDQSALDAATVLPAGTRLDAVVIEALMLPAGVPVSSGLEQDFSSAWARAARSRQGTARRVIGADTTIGIARLAETLGRALATGSRLERIELVELGPEGAATPVTLGEPLAPFDLELGTRWTRALVLPKAPKQWAFRGLLDTEEWTQPIRVDSSLGRAVVVAAVAGRFGEAVGGPQRYQLATSVRLLPPKAGFRLVPGQTTARPTPPAIASVLPPRSSKPQAAARVSNTGTATPRVEADERALIRSLASLTSRCTDTYQGEDRTGTAALEVVRSEVVHAEVGGGDEKIYPCLLETLWQVDPGPQGSMTERVRLQAEWTLSEQGLLWRWVEGG